MVYLVSRIALLFLPSFIPDLREFALWGEALLAGQNPYEVSTLDPQGTLVLKYPPLFYLQASGILAVFGFTQIGVRAGCLFYDIGIVGVIYLFCCDWANSRETANLLAPPSPPSADASQAVRPVVPLVCYAFCPLTLVIIQAHPFLLMAPFFLLLGMWLYWRDRHELAAVALCAGFLTELFPVFALVPILLRLLLDKRWKKVASTLASFAATFVACCLPFILYDPATFLHNFLVHLSRYPQALSLWELLQNFLPWDLVNLLDVATVSPVGVVFILAFGGYVAGFLYHARKTKTGGRDPRHAVLAFAVVFYLVFPFLFLSLFYRYLFWTFPLLVVFLDPGSPNLPDSPDSLDSPPSSRSLRSMRLAEITTLLLVVAAVVALVAWPTLGFTDLRGAEGNLYYAVLYYNFTICLFIPLLGLWILGSGLFRVRELAPGPFTVLRGFLVVLGLFLFQAYEYFVLTGPFENPWTGAVFPFLFPLGFLVVGLVINRFGSEKLAVSPHVSRALSF